MDTGEKVESRTDMVPVHGLVLGQDNIFIFVR